MTPDDLIALSGARYRLPLWTFTLSLLWACLACTPSDTQDRDGVGSGNVTLSLAPLANRFVGTQHPSALGPLNWQVNTGEGRSYPLDTVAVVTPAEQIRQAKMIFEAGPSAYMIDFEGKVNDIASIAKLVEYAVPGLNLFDDVYEDVHRNIIQNPTGALPVTTRENWNSELWHPLRSNQTFQLGWDADESGEMQRREIYVRLPDKKAKANLDRTSVITEIARINILYALHQIDRGNPLESQTRKNCTKEQTERGLTHLNNAVVRLIEPQSENKDDAQKINLAYDETYLALLDTYANRLNRPELFGLLTKTSAENQTVPLLPVQGVTLVEDPATVVQGASWLRDYLQFYLRRYGQGSLPNALLFIAGSDLNRIVGGVAGELLRSVLINRLLDLQTELASNNFMRGIRTQTIKVIPWIGAGGGPSRSGPGTLVPGVGFKEYKDGHALLNYGIARTFQPDGLEAGVFPVHKQPDFEQIKMVFDVAHDFNGPPERGLISGSTVPKFDKAEESRRIFWAGITMVSHFDRVNRYALPAVRLRDLLERHNQVGRVKSGATSSEADPGNAVAPNKQEVYGREWPTFEGYVLNVLGNKDVGFNPAVSTLSNDVVTNAYLQASLASVLTELQSRIQQTRDWTPQNVKATRAINDAFARYILGAPLTTSHGIGSTLRLLDKYIDPGETTLVRAIWGSSNPTGDAPANPISYHIGMIRKGLGIPEESGARDYQNILDKVPAEVKGLWQYYVRNDGFAVIRTDPDQDPKGADEIETPDRQKVGNLLALGRYGRSDTEIIERRLRVVFPEGTPNVNKIIEQLRSTGRLEVNSYAKFIGYLVMEYQRDVLALETFLGCPLYDYTCSGVDEKDASAYRTLIVNLVNNDSFKVAMQENGRPSNWHDLMREIVKLLSIPGWNRIG